MALLEEFESQGNVLFKNRSYLPLLLFPPSILSIWQSCQHHPYYYHNGYFEFLLICCFVVGLLGLSFRIYTVGYANKNTSGRNTHGQVADALNTEGFYSVVRHPLYLGNFLMWLSIAFLSMNFYFIVAFILAFWLYYERIMFAEEQYLRNKFREKFTSWANNKPAFIPTIKGWQKPTADFNWKKLFRNEKNGLFALFLIFWLFKVMITFFETGSYRFSIHWIEIGTILSGIMYFILKFFKTYSNLLETN
ncbi:MAG: isoprenylcysteine carboxylmethyltransferase family protein [Saprospiraceae bacterium]